MEVEVLERQHLESYKMAILELIRNNTETFVMEDVVSLLKQPPLDSMDMIKSKLLSLSKRQGLILNTEDLNEVLLNYRTELIESFANIGDERIVRLSKVVEEFSPKKENQVIKLSKLDFSSVHKQIKKDSKQKLTESATLLLKKLPIIFKVDSALEKKEKVIEQMEKYITSNYTKDLLESIELKMMIKDTTLVNSITEQGERYLFTKENSRLFDSKNEL